MEKAGEEEKRDMIITSMNDPCKWLQETFRAILNCLGLDTSSQPSSSSSSSYSGENGEDQKRSFQQLPIPADDDDPPQLISSLRSRPRRPGLGSGGGDPQTNDASS